MQNDLPLAPPSTTRATSLAVFEQIRAEGLISGARLRALTILVDATSPMTGAELDAADQAHKGPSFRGHLHKRLPELRRIGVVVVADARECKVTGRRSSTWAVSGRLPSAPPSRPVPSLSRIAVLEKENARQARRIRELEREVSKLRQPAFTSTAMDD